MGDGGDRRRRERDTLRRGDSEDGRCGARREGKARRGICESSDPLACGELYITGRVSALYLRSRGAAPSTSESSVGSFPLCEVMPRAA